MSETVKDWRHVWVTLGRPQEKRGVVSFIDVNGKILESRRFVGDVEVVTNEAGSQSVLLTVVRVSPAEGGET